MRKGKLLLQNKYNIISVYPGEKNLSEIKVILDKPDNEYQFELGALYIKLGSETDLEKLYLKEENCIVTDEKFIYNFENVFEVSSICELSFRHMEIPNNYESNCIVQYTLSEISKLKIDNPIQDFQDHIDNYNNSKIVFSAPFGDGKTTFLNYFFEEFKDKYEVFRVFPVNYSVASNEDIFKYIKTDILFQLLGKDVDFDKSSISITQAFQEYIYLNPKKAIFSFLKNISHLNKEMTFISKSIEAFNEFLKSLLEYHKNQEIDEKTIVEKYIQEIYEKEGSLFEDNFYSQLIRKLLLQISKKETVLVIEDLDRMDPEHVFRILNVVSAHYDSYNYDGDVTSHNKFGFDKIIVVCDVKNIQYIFEHRYGSKVDFKGYFNKFFSSKPFVYNNEHMMKYFVQNINDIKAFGSRNLFYEGLIFLLDIFIENKLIGLRELIKISQNSYYSFLKDNSFVNTYSVEYHKFKKNVFSFPLFYLNEFYTGQLLKNIEFLGSEPLKDNSKYDFWSRIILAGLPYDEGKEVTYIDGIENYSIKRDRDYNFDYWKNGEIVSNKVRFEGKDFFRFLKAAYLQMKSL